MKKIFYPGILLASLMFIGADLWFKIQEGITIESFLTVGVLLLFVVLFGSMSLANYKSLKKNGSMIFRPPFFKDEYVDDVEMYAKKRKNVYSIFGILTGVLMMIRFDVADFSIQNATEVCAYIFGMMAICYGTFESFVVKYNEQKEKAYIEYKKNKKSKANKNENE